MKNKRTQIQELQSSILNELWEQVNNDELSTSVAKNIVTLQSIWNHCDDFKVTKLINSETMQELAVCWMDGLVDDTRLQQVIFRAASNQLMATGTIPTLMSSQSGSYQTVATFQEVSKAIATGQVLFFFEGDKQGLSINIVSVPGKAFDTPENEPTIQDPQVAFVNVLPQNLAAIRNLLRSPDLKVEISKFGTLAENSVALIYMDSVAPKEVVEEARKRLSSYKLEAVTGINLLKESITDHPFSPFPLVDVTERPDKVALSLMAGRIAIMLNGSTLALLAPTTFMTMINSVEDYYTGFEAIPGIRILRHVMYWVSLLLPSLYITILAFRQDLLPTPLLLNVQMQHQGIPFSVILEILIMVVSFEIMREAGIRLPRSVGQSVSIVGTLVIGDAATQAGLVSAGAVIVVAMAGIASFTIPSYSLAYTNRVLQFVFILAASLYGLYGVIVAGLILIAHLVSMHSFGVPYMAPMAPLSLKKLRDSFFRLPWVHVNTLRNAKSFDPPDPEKIQKFPKKTK